MYLGPDNSSGTNNLLTVLPWACRLPRLSFVLGLIHGFALFLSLRVQPRLHLLPSSFTWHRLLSICSAFAGAALPSILPLNKWLTENG